MSNPTQDRNGNTVTVGATVRLVVNHGDPIPPAEQLVGTVERIGQELEVTFPVLGGGSLGFDYWPANECVVQGA